MNEEADLMQVTPEQIKLTKLKWDTEGKFTPESQIKVKRYLKKHGNLSPHDSTTRKNVNNPQVNSRGFTPGSQSKWDSKGEFTPGRRKTGEKEVTQSGKKLVKDSKTGTGRSRASTPISRKVDSRPMSPTSNPKVKSRYNLRSRS